MGILKKLQRKIYSFYRQEIVCEQFPMLTTFSKKEWLEKDAIGFVYTLHHITDKNPNGIPTNEDLKVSPDFLENIIQKYKRKGFIFISLDQLSDIIITGRKPEHPFIAFTIDDGYLDNYTQALPVFERQQVPFAIFVATDFIDKKAILWWDILEDLTLKNDSVIFGGDKYQCQTFQEKWDVFRILREKILQFDQTTIEEELKEAFSYYDIDWFEPVRRQAMSWEQVKDIPHRLGRNIMCGAGLTDEEVNQLYTLLYKVIKGTGEGDGNDASE